jgi:hypothetical protein
MNTSASSGEKVRIQLDLTEAQRTQIRESLGTDAKAVELMVEPLEQRVTPIIAILIGIK